MYAVDGIVQAVEDAIVWKLRETTSELHPHTQYPDVAELNAANERAGIQYVPDICVSESILRPLVVELELHIPYAVDQELMFDWNGNAPAPDILGTPIDVADETVFVERFSLSTDERTVSSPSAPHPIYASVELLVAEEPYLELVSVAGMIAHVSFSDSDSITFRTPNL